MPSLGKVMWWLSGSTRIAPVVNEKFFTARALVLNRGKPIRGPPRVPLREAPQFDNASDSARHALAYTSLEFYGHHGLPSARTAALCLRRLKSLRST